MDLGIIKATRTTTASGAAGEISVIEHFDVHPATLPGITQSGADRAARIGLAILIALNALDLVLTKRFLALGLTEGNPLMVAAVQSWQALACKAIILGALAWSFAHRPATAARLALVWAGVGLYLLGVYVNYGAIRAAQGLLAG